MVSLVGEKVVVAVKAANTLLAGVTHDQILARYRELVAVNMRGHRSWTRPFEACATGAPRAALHHGRGRRGSA